MGDIGKHFPDTNLEYKGIDSKLLLKKVVKLISEKGYSINNIDSTICLQKPKIGSYIPEMQKSTAFMYEYRYRRYFYKSLPLQKN